MKISKIQNQSFGKFENWQCSESIKLTSRDKKTLYNIENYLNENEGQKLKIYGYIGYYDPQRPDKKFIKLVTYPRREDMDILLIHRPNARSHDYMRKSLGFPIYSRFLTEMIKNFVTGQARYIHYCKKHPDHSSLKFPSLHVYKSNIQA